MSTQNDTDGLGVTGSILIFAFVIFGLVLFGLIIWAHGDGSYRSGFHDGQIHALSGQSKLVLTTMPNGESRWQEKP